MPPPDDLSALREKPFSDAVTKLEELLTQNGRAFLIGAGCSKCAGLPLTAELTKEVLGSDALDATSKKVLTAIRDLFKGAPEANIEDFLSELIDHLAVSDRRKLRGATQKAISLGGGTYDDSQLRSAADQIKRGIAKVIEKKVSIDTHQSFVKALHRPIRPGKPTHGQTVNYFVLNYDTLMEDSLALERVPFADGLDGGVTGWWRPDTFDRDGLAARVFKLHGSINWCELTEDPLPRRIGSSLQIVTPDERKILIWPASTKYRETQLDPYAQMAERTRRILRPGKDSQCVLVICGYRFGDSHINIELDRALRESAGSLTIVTFTADNAPTGLLEDWRKTPSLSERVLIFANRGFFHGKQESASNKDLLWWKFENLTRLLGGER